jgi:hypothetical protein
MRRLLAVMVLAMLFGLGALATPPCASACSRMELRPIAEYAREQNAAIFTGRAGAAVGEAVVFAVDHWYWGPGAAPVVTLIPGDSAMCGIAIRPGDQMIMVAYRMDDGRYRPSLCSPHARLDSEEGAKLLAEANAAFGVPPTPTPGATTAPTASPGNGGIPGGGGAAGPEPALMAGAAGIGLLALAVGLAIAVRRRQRAAGDPARPSGESG